MLVCWLRNWPHCHSHKAKINWSIMWRHSNSLKIRRSSPILSWLPYITQHASGAALSGNTTLYGYLTDPAAKLPSRCGYIGYSAGGSGDPRYEAWEDLAPSTTFLVGHRSRQVSYRDIGSGPRRKLSFVNPRSRYQGRRPY